MRPAKRILGMGLTVFSEFSKLAEVHGAINLGQGFPDFDGPDSVREAVEKAMRDGKNQYAFTRGAPVLREAIAAHAERFYGQHVDPTTEVVVTSGATEAIFDAVCAFVDPGDEVVLFQPAYDSYTASVQIAGGTPRSVVLQPPDAQHPTWWFDRAALAAAFGPRTKLVLLNTPHNPTGKVFSKEELGIIGELAEAHGALVIADEVYEHIAFSPHTRMATLFPKQTLTISSSGKTFSFTGWKIGWAKGPADVITAVQNVHQWVTFATSTPMQHAIATALSLPDAFFADVLARYGKKRDLLTKALPFPVLPCEGTYFLIADVSRLGHDTDIAACRWLTEHARVAAIPPSVFYAPEKGPQRYARFAFCKRDSVLEEAASRLAKL